MTILRVDSHIEDRARLMFVFPTSDADEKRILPFFENVTIRESKQAKLIKYNPIGRASNSFGYVGADSRKLSLTFNMTLPNIAAMVTAGVSNNLAYRKKGIEAIQKEFLEGAFTGASGTTDYDSIKYEKRWREVLGEDDDNEEFLLLQHKALTTRSPMLLEPGSQSEEAPGKFAGRSNRQIQLKYRIIDTIVFWANLIRASVLNNATNPFYGPPIVRLTYGVLYQDIPCVCSSYKIAADDKAGYDQRTMLPRIIGVTMDLLEVREGDRGKYTPGVAIKRDNLAGWESVLDETIKSTDPMSIR